MSATGIGQAFYTWATVLPDGGSGEGFVTESPSLRDQRQWLAAETKGLTNFAGSGGLMSPEERDAYKPIGRRLGRESAFCYRKVYAGVDGMGRPGRQIVQFLVAVPSLLTLSELLRIPPTWWLSPDKYPVNAVPELDDLQPGSIGQRAKLLTCGPDDASRVVQNVETLIRKRTLDVSDWAFESIRIVMACLPTWCDATAELTTDWTSSGPSIRLSLAGRNVDRATLRDERDNVQDPLLLELRERLNGVRNREELARTIDPGSAIGGPATVYRSGSPGGTSDLLIRQAIRVWLDGRSGQLTTHERHALVEDATQTMSSLRTSERRFPSRRGADALAVEILRRNPEMDSHLVAAVLPSDDDGVVTYLKAIATPAMLKACLVLNEESGRWIQIPAATLSDAMLAELVESCKKAEGDVRALIRTMTVSMRGNRQFARALLRARAVDYAFLYERVVPGVESSSFGLASLIAENPAEFVRWQRIEPPYDSVLIDVLRVESFRLESPHDFWQRLSAMLISRARRT